MIWRKWSAGSPWDGDMVFATTHTNLWLNTTSPEDPPISVEGVHIRQIMVAALTYRGEPVWRQRCPV
jgi:hypothetical protein